MVKISKKEEKIPKNIDKFNIILLIFNFLRKKNGSKNLTAGMVENIIPICIGE